MSNLITVRNPHSVLAALKTRPEDVVRVALPSQIEKTGDEAWKSVWELSKRHKVQIVSGVSTDSRNRDKHHEGGRASIAEAQIKPKESLSVEELFEGAQDRKNGKGIWIALDSLTDPHNVGAIFRAASFFGVEGVLMTQERSAPLTGSVYDVSCGGVEYVPHTMHVNLQRAFEVAKEAGLWILGTSEHAKESYLKLERDRPWLVVFGNEEKGMRRLTEESCDVLTAVPPLGDVTSLNVSVAAGVLLSRLSSLSG